MISRNVSTGIRRLYGSCGNTAGLFGWTVSELCVPIAFVSLIIVLCSYDTVVLDSAGTSTEGVPSFGSAALYGTASGQVLSPTRGAKAVAVGKPGLAAHFCT